ncbi:type 2 isopentenyl-diphosphate Delta-isomerase [Schaalia turicensis]|uniref:type 2 isopentenyl-diphosphate Delta-isomerase n=1 Tax=Actinotignum sanguinis TaxID=1445614 RepID=UPI00237DAF8F|nr:type 2 isopentenyl-diphosphate Delta-isomerase [Actinotignum sanguinis]MDE1552834.1 type 2 isopentenyl-diphosphate Delta-isomerase [Actinotignum sanguinis]MDE1565593.1 type 2 isopentenyl-diphosphate Delta-isomerase [Actinotignum sanguinis]MDE1577363.1 type 2 isopentenyl-diphosphate Delta-isomerase [Actinotignum sanguinis]MDE1642919.1 type 2 isopentenyl-diphosphate Delta-isomerase [Actinotignum sanguinis]MDK8353865.1 type 2 isopentenyl-diphosphate Delta-isomerase [Actinotignum sanguinis]
MSAANAAGAAGARSSRGAGDGAGAQQDTSRAARKDEHVALARAQEIRRNDFDCVNPVHHALAACDVAAVDLSTRVGPFSWPVPFYINGMTGGTEATGNINRVLAIAAREVGVPMASGSASVALDDPSTASSFTVIREENPRGFVMGNIGVGRSGADARRVVELLEADALQLHLNAGQEIVMPEGEREFSGWRASVEEIAAQAGVPVIVKEVGFGISRETQRVLTDLGVQVVDVGGVGGTDFARIENSRRKAREYSYLDGFGQSAPLCLLEAEAESGLDLLASGGVRTPFDVVRALILGARAAGVARQFLELAVQGEEAAVAGLRSWRDQVRALLALLGVRTVSAARQCQVFITGELAERARLRGVDLESYARRGAAHTSLCHATDI